MKSICILVQNYYEIDIRVRRKAEALVAAGYSVDVFALASSYSESKEYTLNGVNVCTLSLGKKRGSIIRYLFEYLAFCLWCAFKVAACFGKRRYCIVDVNNLPDFLVFAGAYAKLRGAKIVFDMHEITPEFYMSKYGISERAWLIRFLKFIEKASFSFADYVITINEPIRELLERRGLTPSKCIVIMNSVDESLFAPASKALAAPEPMATQPSFVMMYHGTLTRIYGLDIALQAFGMVQAEMPEAQFWILGNGPEKSSLEALTQKLSLVSNVRFIGSVLPQEVNGWLSRCDVGVLATRRDAFLDLSSSNKLSEYIIMGKAVIASRLKATRYSFSEEALAFFEPNNLSDLSRQMVRLYKDSGLRLRFSERARQEYAPLRWEIMKRRYLDLIGSLVSRTGAAKEQLLAPTADVVEPMT
jgi:glycosyltransferase involved in cell wall biosynthesis